MAARLVIAMVGATEDIPHCSDQEQKSESVLEGGFKGGLVDQPADMGGWYLSGTDLLVSWTV
jgi:hypothetical protein